MTDLFNSAQFYKTYRLNLHKQLNKGIKEKRRQWKMGIIQIAKANLVDDPYNKLQLQTELGVDLFYKEYFFMP